MIWTWDIYIDSDTYYEMDRVFGYSISDVLASFSAFVLYDYPNILEFYSGKRTEIDAQANTSFQLIKSQIYQAIDDMIVNRERMSRHAGYWDLQEILDDMKSSVDTIDNMDKWSRSRTGSASVKQTTLGFNQTIESIAFDSGLSEAEWAQLAISNNLMETDYTATSGNQIDISSKNDPNPIDIRDVVDVMSGVNMYGKDILSKITFDADSNDLITVYGVDCRDQLLDNAFKCILGSVPEDLNFGYENVPSSKASYPIDVVVRQLTTVILHDDAISDASISDVKYQGDGYIVTMNISDKLGSRNILKQLN